LDQNAQGNAGAQPNPAPNLFSGFYISHYNLGPYAGLRLKFIKIFFKFIACN
jgi:hypothetical protein